MHRLAIQLQSAIEASGYSRTEVCEICKIAPAALSKYLNGKMHPRKNVISRLSKVIPDEFIGPVYSAYLLDFLPEGAEKHITIEALEPTKVINESEEPYLTHQKLPRDLEQAFAFLRSFTAKNPAMANFILSTCKLMDNSK